MTVLSSEAEIISTVRRPFSSLETGLHHRRPLHPLCWARTPVTAQQAAERFCTFPTGTGPETQPPQKTPRQTGVSNSVCAHREETGTDEGT